MLKHGGDAVVQPWNTQIENRSVSVSCNQRNAVAPRLCVLQDTVKRFSDGDFGSILGGKAACQRRLSTLLSIVLTPHTAGGISGEDFMAPRFQARGHLIESLHRSASTSQRLQKIIHRA